MIVLSCQLAGLALVKPWGSYWESFPFHHLIFLYLSQTQTSFVESPESHTYQISKQLLPSLPWLLHRELLAQMPLYCSHSSSLHEKLNESKYSSRQSIFNNVTQKSWNWCQLSTDHTHLAFRLKELLVSCKQNCLLSISGKSKDKELVGQENAVVGWNTSRLKRRSAFVPCHWYLCSSYQWL